MQGSRFAVYVFPLIKTLTGTFPGPRTEIDFFLVDIIFQAKRYLDALSSAAGFSLLDKPAGIKTFPQKGGVQIL